MHANTQSLRSFVQPLLIGRPVRRGPLAVVPILARHDAPPRHARYVGFATASAAGVVRIAETGKEGETRRLRIEVGCDRPVLFVEGEVIAAGAQHWLGPAGALAPPRRETWLPAACIRWGRSPWRGEEIAPALSFGPPALRSPLPGPSVPFEAVCTARAGEIANAVGALSAIFDRKVHGLATGAVAVVDGRPIAADVFDRPATFQRLAPRLLGGYVLETLDAPEGLFDEDREVQAIAARLLGDASLARTRAGTSQGMGVERRIEGRDLVGSALVLDHGIVHLALFAA